MYKYEVKRAFFSKKMIVCILITATFCLANALIILNSNTAYDASLTFENLSNKIVFTGFLSGALNNFIFLTKFNRATEIYVLFFPLLVGFVYSYSYSSEKSAGFHKMIKVKASFNKYLKSKILSVYLSGGTVAGSYIILTLITNLLFFPLLPVNKYFFSIDILSSSLFPNLFYANPYLYILLWTAIYFVVGGFVSVIGLTASTFLKNSFLVFISPFFLITIVGVLAGPLSTINQSLIQLSLPRILRNQGTTPASLILFLIGTLILFFIFYNVEKKKDEF